MCPRTPQCAHPGTASPTASYATLVRVTDWLSWHQAYDDPGSSLARRLEVVRRRLSQALDGLSAAEPLLLSLCAGDGRDVVGVLAARAPRCQVTAVLIERDATLACRASAAAARTGLSSVQVRCGDAGDPASFSGVLPVDVLMLCGIFGNIEHAAVKRLIKVIPRLLRLGGYVIWTRGASEPDRRPEIRQWFRSAGLEEVAFDGGPEPYGVGMNQQRGQPVLAHEVLSDRLFTFR